jgi:hypothetical protein
VSWIHGQLPRDEAGDTGLGDYGAGVVRSVQLALPVMSVG